MRQHDPVREPRDDEPLLVIDLRGHLFGGRHLPQGGAVIAATRECGAERDMGICLTRCPANRAADAHRFRSVLAAQVGIGIEGARAVERGIVRRAVREAGCDPFLIAERFEQRKRVGEVRTRLRQVAHEIVRHADIVLRIRDAPALFQALEMRQCLLRDANPSANRC